MQFAALPAALGNRHPCSILTAKPRGQTGLLFHCLQGGRSSLRLKIRNPRRYTSVLRLRPLILGIHSATTVDSILIYKPLVYNPLVCNPLVYNLPVYRLLVCSSPIRCPSIRNPPICGATVCSTPVKRLGFACSLAVSLRDFPCKGPIYGRHGVVIPLPSSRKPLGQHALPASWTPFRHRFADSTRSHQLFHT